MHSIIKHREKRCGGEVCQIFMSARYPCLPDIQISIDKQKQPPYTFAHRKQYLIKKVPSDMNFVCLVAVGCSDKFPKRIETLEEVLTFIR